MDRYGNQVSFSKAEVVRAPIQVVKLDLEIGPVGCWACTSGDFPVFDFEQNVLAGY